MSTADIVSLTFGTQDSKVISNKRGYTELSTQKGGVFFTTSDLRDLSKQYTDTNEQYQRMQSSLVKEVIAIAGEFAELES